MQRALENLKSAVHPGLTPTWINPRAFAVYELAPFTLGAIQCRSESAADQRRRTTFSFAPDAPMSAPPFATVFTSRASAEPRRAIDSRRFGTCRTGRSSIAGR